MTSTVTAAPATTLDEAELRRFEIAMIAVVRGVMASHHQFDSGLDKAGYVLLNAVERMGAVRSSDIACRMSLDLSTISRGLKNLEELGFVTRSADPDDRRASVVTATAAGRRELARQRKARWAPVAERLADIDPHDRERFVGFLEELAHLSSPQVPLGPTGPHGKVSR